MKEPKEDIYKPISLKCPTESFGIIEIVRKNRNNGTRVRTIGRYKDGTLANLVLEMAKPGEGFSLALDGPPYGNLRAESGRILFAAAAQTQRIKTVVCDSHDPTIRERYSVILQNNSRELEHVGTKTK